MEVALFDEANQRVVYLDTSFVASDDESGLILSGRLAADGDGRIGLQDLSIRMDPDAPLSPRQLRELPWSRILDGALDAGSMKATRVGEAWLVDPSEQPGGADVRRQRKGGRRRLDDDHYRRVAQLYRSALIEGRDPVMAVKESMAAARSTAAGWVGEARRRGHLGPAPAPGSKGER